MKRILFCMLLLLVTVSLSVEARLGSSTFDWAEHEKAADLIVIAKMKSHQILKEEKALQVHYDVMVTLKGKEISFADVLVNQSINSPDAGEITPDKYCLAFLKEKTGKWEPLDIDISFISFPEYFPLNIKTTPKEALLFELENCLKSKNIETVKAALKAFNNIGLDIKILPAPELLRPLAKNQDSEIKSIALILLLKQKDRETIDNIEKTLSSGQENIGILGNIFYLFVVLNNPDIFSTKACNILASSKDIEIKKAGIYMLRTKADISSIPVLLKALECENEDIQYSAYCSLMFLTGRTMQEKSIFKKQKVDILKYWKNWEAKEADAFMKDPKNAKKTTKNSNDLMSLGFSMGPE